MDNIIFFLSGSAVPWRGKRADQCPDGPRYKACDNSMAVNVMSWLYQSIDLFDKNFKKAKIGKTSPA